jgi:DNA repair protein RadC
MNITPIYEIVQNFKLIEVRETHQTKTDRDIYFNILKKRFNPFQEIFFVIGLDGSMNSIYIDEVFKGTANQCLVHPRDIFQRLIIANCSAFIIAHNHPSISVNPSKQDYELTDRFIRAGNLMGINLVDHIIFTDEKYFSFNKTGYIKKICPGQD